METFMGFTGKWSVLEEPGRDTNLGLAMADGHNLQATARPEPAVSLISVRCAIRPHTKQRATLPVLNLSRVHRPQQLGNNGVKIPSFSLATYSMMCHPAQEPPGCRT